jgi:hypothetical protein
MSVTERLRVPLIGVLGVIMAVVGFAAPATAAPYTHDHATTSVSNSNPAAGSTITFCGADFLPGERVTITLERTSYPSVNASSSGSWCTTIALSSALSGNLTLTGTGMTSHRSSSTVIRIQTQLAADSANAAGGGANAAAGTTSGGLVFTGTNAIGVGALGGLLLLGGVTLVLVSRRRKVNA